MEIEVLGDDFEFPSNLGQMSFAQREDLRLNYLRHTAVQGFMPSSELSPSQVMDAPEIQRRRAQRAAERVQARMAYSAGGSLMFDEQGTEVEFDPEVGYIIREQGQGLTRNISKEEAAGIMSVEAVRIEIEADRREYAKLSAP